MTFLARPSLIDLAISREFVPSGYSRTAPSGNVILIMKRPFLLRVAKLTNSCQI
jgi:hypothetical protein